ncbi:C40 family peptidase [Nicoliella lavandulae]|uniref:NlpC/P60 family protein n=1 Tax=Nicoliella lavandulae TaxID=3082954 RepID=A0ABU8SIZ4_9LACO
MNYKKLSKLLLVPLFSVSMFFGINNNHQPAAHAASKRAVKVAYQVAESKLGSPYTYGASGPTTFDCSGFTQYIYEQAHVNIARTAQGQYETTKPIQRTQLKKGDLVYFGDSSDSISHVGFYIGNGQMIDAQNNGVITENIDAPWWSIVGYSRP